MKLKDHGMKALYRTIIKRIFTPVHLPIISFALVIFIGTFLLILPVATTGKPLSFINAFFTATSATCVTGLIVVDTGSVLSHFGQIVVLGLIQFGGLGIMTFSTILILIFSGRLSLLNRSVLQDTFTYGPSIKVHSIILHVLSFTALLEGVGTLLLYSRFSKVYNHTKALYFSIFHSISAFCNAGFSLFSDSLMGFQHDVLLNLTFCGLIILGGLGFLVLLELKRVFLSNVISNPIHRLSLHSKIVLSTTLILLISGTVGFLVIEWNNSMKSLGIGYKVLSAFFQSVTTRTAGFNTLDLTRMANVSLFLSIILMFIGAGSGSTGGGIKVNTIGVLFALSKSYLLSEKKPTLFKRTISQETIGRAISVFVVSVLTISVALMALLITELGTIPHEESRGMFLEILFEVISAFGTVGLSVGVTPKLSEIGKLIIIVLMFTGRLGPLSLAIALLRKEKAMRMRYEYAEENVMIG